MSIKMSIVFYKCSVPLYKYFKENTNTLLQLQAFEAFLLSHISSALFSPAQLKFPGPLWCCVRAQSCAQPGTLEPLGGAELTPRMLYSTSPSRPDGLFWSNGGCCLGIVWSVSNLCW